MSKSSLSPRFIKQSSPCILAAIFMLFFSMTSVSADGSGECKTISKRKQKAEVACSLSFKEYCKCVSLAYKIFFFLLALAEIACSISDFDILCEALHATGLDNTLNRRGPTWTIFAPLDSAFEALPNDVLEPMRLFRENLEFLILTHAISGKVLKEDDLDCGMEVTMASMEPTRTDCRDSDNQKFQLGRGNSDDDLPQIVMTDIQACNGVIHILDGVVLPERLPMMPGNPDYCPHCPKETTPYPTPVPTPYPTPASKPPTEKPALPPTFPPSFPP
jgi:uncharacterized surface protein with fasciclin (FAS1) repeats